MLTNTLIIIGAVAWLISITMSLFGHREGIVGRFIQDNYQALVKMSIVGFCIGLIGLMTLGVRH